MALQFVILRDDSLIAVGNSVISPISLTGLAANIAQVSFQKTEGKIQYNDRPPNPVEFTDPSPYQSYLNTWITAAAALSPALQLAQAKQVKKDLVEAIFHHKRRLPYTYGAWQYDARDEAMANMGQLLRGNADTSLVGSINTALAAITNQINSTVVGGANAMVTANNNSAAAVNAWSANSNANWALVVYITGQLGAPYGSPPYIYPSGPGSGGFGNMASVGAIAGATVAAAGNYTGNITHMPLNATAPQTIPAIDIANALLGIATRYNSLNSNRLTKQVAIGNLATIAACASYDATTGWSF